MDVYNLIQGQLTSIDKTLQSTVQKLSDEISQVTRRLDQIEQHTGRTTSNVNALNDKLETIKTRVDVLPKVFSNQVGLMESFLVGHQYQYKRISNLLARDSETTSFGEPLNRSSQVPATTMNSHSSHGHSHHDEDGLGDVNHANSDHQPHHILNRVNSVQSTGSQTPSQLQQNQTNRIVPQNRVNQSPVNLTLISENGQSRTQQPSTQQTSVSTSSLPRFNLMQDLSNDQMSLPTMAPAAANDDGLSNINDVVEDESRRMWDGVVFTKLNPHPKSVQEVLEEYYYGYEGQPPLKYLEKYRREWRKGNKNLSKTFCRRYRIIVAVENGVRQFMRDFGLNENVARERIVNDLENMRVKENGKKETMYWLFHHVPQHLKRTQ